MRLTISRDEFYQGVLALSVAAEPISTLPLLSHLLVDAADAHVCLTATNLTLTVRRELPAHVTEPGRIALPANKLHDILRELPQLPVDLDTTDLTATLACSCSDFTIKGLPPDDFPALRRPSDPPLSLSLDRPAFRGLLRRVLPAVSHQPSRYATNNVLVRIAPDAITAFATDGHRLAIARYGPSPDDATTPAAPWQTADRLEALIPYKSAVALVKLLSDRPGTVRLDLSGDHLMLATDTLTVHARLTDSRFPEVQPLLAAVPPIHILFPRTALLDALHRTSAILTGHGAPTTFAIQPGALTLTCTNNDLGLAKEAIAIEYTGEPITINFNAKYMIDFLNIATTNEIALHLEDPLSPVRFTGLDDDSYTYILMPMRL